MEGSLLCFLNQHGRSQFDTTRQRSGTVLHRTGSGLGLARSLTPCCHLPMPPLWSSAPWNTKPHSATLILSGRQKNTWCKVHSPWKQNHPAPWKTEPSGATFMHPEKLKCIQQLSFSKNNNNKLHCATSCSIQNKQNSVQLSHSLKIKTEQSNFILH